MNKYKLRQYEDERFQLEIDEDDRVNLEIFGQHKLTVNEVAEVLDLVSMILNELEKRAN